MGKDGARTTDAWYLHPSAQNHTPTLNWKVYFFVEKWFVDLKSWTRDSQWQKKFAKRTSESTPNTPHFIGPICSIGQHNWDILKKKLLSRAHSPWSGGSWVNRFFMVLSSDTDAPQTKLSHTADSTYKGLKLTMLAYFILVKFIYSEKATKFYEISTLLLS